ncbi:MAG TPA: hypothetical protein VJV79_15310 [Polyangiaceae bacterium]|nr:hypothetical protein [Polyangiaceae bacterium]
MKFAQLATGFGVCAWLTACAVQQSPEPNAPAASATGSGAKAAAAEEQAVAPESPRAAPAPAARDGLDTAKSKRAEDEAEFSTLEAAERALNQAKADLDRLALAEPSPTLGNSATAQRSTEKKEGKPGRAPSAAGAPAPSKAAPVKASTLCEEACRAFSSLSRAASAVCRLDGNSGTHCSHAKHVLADAEQRVASCSCPASSD